MNDAPPGEPIRSGKWPPRAHLTISLSSAFSPRYQSGRRRPTADVTAFVCPGRVDYTLTSKRGPREKLSHVGPAPWHRSTRGRYSGIDWHRGTHPRSRARRRGGASARSEEHTSE